MNVKNMRRKNLWEIIFKSIWIKGSVIRNFVFLATLHNNVEQKYRYNIPTPVFNVKHNL